MLLLTMWYSGRSLEYLDLEERMRRPIVWRPTMVTVRGPWRSEVV